MSCDKNCTECLSILYFRYRYIDIDTFNKNEINSVYSLDIVKKKFNDIAFLKIRKGQKF